MILSYYYTIYLSRHLHACLAGMYYAPWWTTSTRSNSCQGGEHQAYLKFQHQTSTAKDLKEPAPQETEQALLSELKTKQKPTREFGQSMF